MNIQTLDWFNENTGNKVSRFSQTGTWNSFVDVTEDNAAELHESQFEDNPSGEVWRYKMDAA